MVLLLTLPLYANGKQTGKESIVILFSDGMKKMDLNDLSTVTSKPRRIVFHMLHNVIPQQCDLPIRLEPVSWSRGLELIKLGFADGIFGASYNEKRAKYAVYPMKDGQHNPAKRLRGVTYSLYKFKNSSIEWDGKQITGIDGEIGAVKSYAIVRDLREMGVNIQEYQFEMRIMKDVAIGKLKAIAMQEDVVNEFIQPHPLLGENIIKLTPPLKKKALIRDERIVFLV